MKRILIMVLRNILLVPYMWCKLCYHASHPDKYTEEQQYKMLGLLPCGPTRAGMSISMSMEKKIFRKKMDSCFSRIIRDYMMFLQWWKRVRSRFPWWRKRKWPMFLFSSRCSPV